MTVFRKISRDQEHQLIQIFLHMGQQVVAPMCVEWGVSPGYARNRALELGLMPRRKTKGAGHIHFNVNHQDPRWQWAIQRGSIVA